MTNRVAVVGGAGRSTVPLVGRLLAVDNELAIHHSGGHEAGVALETPPECSNQRRTGHCPAHTRLAAEAILITSTTRSITTEAMS